MAMQEWTEEDDARADFYAEMRQQGYIIDTQAERDNCRTCRKPICMCDNEDTFVDLSTQRERFYSLECSALNTGDYD